MASIIACMRILRFKGLFETTDHDFDTIVKKLWAQADEFSEYFVKPGIQDKLAKNELPSFESLYPRFFKQISKDFEIAKKEKGDGHRRRLRDLVLFILSFELGWRPHDLVHTIRLENISRKKTKDGREFFFVEYQPSKTTKKRSSKFAKSALPPWFNPIFEAYFELIKDDASGDLFLLIKKIPVKNLYPLGYGSECGVCLIDILN